jgi:hypothetical protein
MHKYAGKAPTCTQVGWNEYESCSRCSRTTYTGIPAKGHSYKSTVTEPTCTEEGYTTNVCSVCNDVSKTNIVAVLDHKLNHVEGKEATVEAEGNIEYWTCQDCKGMWTDEACTKTTTEEAVVLAKLEVPATEATTVPATGPVPETTVGATNEKDEGTKTPTLLWGGLIVLIVLAAVIVLGIKKFGKK